MNIKNIISAILLIFVAASVVTAIAKETNRPPETAAQPGVSATATGTHYIATYFRTNVRCKSCLKIENYSQTTIEETYKDQIKDGLLEFRTINTDEPENKHYIDEYLLYTKHVVLSEYVDGQQTRWKNLDRVWELLGDEKQFRDYIEVEVSNFLDQVPDEDVVIVKTDRDGSA